MKDLVFLGDSYRRYIDMPASILRRAGYELYHVQIGKLPSDWKPMPTIGAGAAEIRVSDGSGTFRVFYVAKFAGAVYVLHAMQKKTQQTPQADLDLAARRYRDLVAALKDQNHGQ